MNADDIAKFPSEYMEMMQGKLSKRLIVLLDGADIKSHEGMVFGQMYADWKKRKGFETE